MKNGFIQVPTLVIILLSTLVVGGAGYFVFEKYDDYQKTEAANKEAEMQVLKNRIDELESTISTVSPVMAVSQKTEQVKSTSFQKKPEAITVPPSVPIGSGLPSAQTQGESKIEISSVRAIPSDYSTIIKWSTNLLSNGQVTYWRAVGGVNKLTLNTYNQTEHQVIVPTDQAGKTYSYIIEVTTVDGRSAASDEKEFTTLFDVIDPQVDSIEVIRPISKNIIDFHIKTSEPTKAILKYSIENTMDDIQNQIISSADFASDFIISMPMPNGWYETSVVKFSVSVYDRANNSSTTIQKSQKISEIWQK